METYSNERHFDLIPEKAVLLNIDLQNDFLHEEGWYAKSGVDISHMQRVIGPLSELIPIAREKMASVLYTRHGIVNEIDAGTLFRVRPFLKEGGLRINTWGWQILDELAPEQGDWIVDKRRPPAFYMTPLEAILRGMPHVDTVVITGVLTNQCVAGTSREASYRDYKTIVISDCCGTIHPELHEPSLRMTQVGWGDVWPLEDIVKVLA